MGLYTSPLRDKVLAPGTSIHTMDVSRSGMGEIAPILDNVHTLSLIGTKVTDVSAFGTVRVLYLAGTPITDISALDGVPVLDIRFPPGADDLVFGITSVPHNPWTTEFIMPLRPHTDIELEWTEWQTNRTLTPQTAVSAPENE